MDNSKSRKARPINSCDTCRRRRLKCDKTHPECGRCAAAGVHCSYAGEATVSREQPDRGTRPASRETPSDLQDVGANTQPNASDRGSLFVEAGGRSTYLGPTFWGNTISPNFYADIDLAQLNPFPRWPPIREHDGFDREASHSRHFLFSRRHPGSRCKKCGERYRLQCVFNILPKRSICEKLIDLFFISVFTLTPILHLPTFAADHREFWRAGAQYGCQKSSSGTILERKPSFIALYFSMLFAATKSVGSSMIGDLLVDEEIPLVADLYFAATISTTLVGFPRRPSLYSLAAFIFAQSQFIREEEFPDAPSFIETAFRVALGMGLHRDFGNSELLDAERETRRRLWWHVIHLDVMAAASSGLSPLWIDEMMSNTSLMSEYEDFCESGADPRVDLRHILAIHRYRCTKEIRRILRSHFDDALHSIPKINEHEKQLEELGLNFRTLIRSLLESKHHAAVDMHMSTSRSISNKNLHSIPGAFEQLWGFDAEFKHPTVAAFRSWAAILLHLMLHKAFLTLYHPLFRNGDVNLRSRAIKHSQAFVHHFIRMCEHPACESFRWIYPGIYQPLQALSLLLADLTDPQSDEAGTSRGLVDATFQLYEVDEGIVSHKSHGDRRELSPFGREAWSMLIRTRRRALEQMGKDPHVLLPNVATSGDICVCCEEVTLNDQLMGTRVKNHPEIGDLPHEDPETPQMSDVDVIGFNWDEWDSLLGNATSVLA